MPGPKRKKKRSSGGTKPPPQTPGANLPAPSVVVGDHRWRGIGRRIDVLARRAASEAGGAGCVVLSTDLAVKRLNSDHRRKNRPTNVLTFDAMAGRAGYLGGDIILALQTVKREAAASGRTPAHHMAHLVVHGALHLSGHDHDRAGDARRMEMAEARILHRLGVPNPWKRA